MPGAVAPTPRIVYPGQHNIPVLDPDIPPQHQRVFLTMRPPQAGLFWRLNGAPQSRRGTRLGAVPGRFKLSLVDARACALDEVLRCVTSIDPHCGKFRAL